MEYSLLVLLFISCLQSLSFSNDLLFKFIIQSIIYSKDKITNKPLNETPTVILQCLPYEVLSGRNIVKDSSAYNM